MRYEAGVLDVDFKETLINYMVDNNIMFPQEANWDEIVNNPLLHGTTATYLSKTYGQVKSNTMRKYPNISKSEITPKIMQKYLRERKTQPSATRKNLNDLCFISEPRFELTYYHVLLNLK